LSGLITIITINFNDAQGLKKTILSVLGQSSQEIEYIIIDGGSTDDSVAILKQYEDQLSYWISEPDKGIYAAMNKGIDKATGDYLLFLNSGDVLYDTAVISKFISFKSDCDIVYGNTCLTNGKQQELKTMSHVHDLASSLSNTINHQSIFFSKRLFNNNQRYNLAYSIIADWVFVNDAVRLRQATFQYIDLVISIYDTTGVSSNWDTISEQREYYMQTNFSADFRNVLKSYQNQVTQYNSFRNRPLIKKLLQIKNLFKSKK